METLEQKEEKDYNSFIIKIEDSFKEICSVVSTQYIGSDTTKEKINKLKNRIYEYLNKIDNKIYYDPKSQGVNFDEIEKIIDKLKKEYWKADIPKIQKETINKININFDKEEKMRKLKTRKSLGNFFDIKEEINKENCYDIFQDTIIDNLLLYSLDELKKMLARINNININEDKKIKDFIVFCREEIDEIIENKENSIQAIKKEKKDIEDKKIKGFFEENINYIFDLIKWSLTEFDKNNLNLTEFKENFENKFDELMINFKSIEEIDISNSTKYKILRDMQKIQNIYNKIDLKQIQLGIERGFFLGDLYEYIIKVNEELGLKKTKKYIEIKQYYKKIP